MRILLAALLAIGCSQPCAVSDTERRAIVDSLTRQVKAAYDLSQPNVPERLLSLYPPSGRIVSASAGEVITSRDTLALGIEAFWENVGVNMRQPKWIWDQMIFDVLSPSAAVMTATYHVPHLTPRNMPHTIGGAWTAVFEKRDGRWYIIQEHLSDLPPTMFDTSARSMPGMAMPPANTAKPKPAKSPPKPPE
ncbi:MAG: hypothetical protein ABI442_11565 [Gemmatimonadaceae bacterium]